MEVAVKITDEVNDKIAMETLFSYLDKGIDDMEAGRMHTADEAFWIIRVRMNNELQVWGADEAVNDIFVFTRSMMRNRKFMFCVLLNI